MTPIALQRYARRLMALGHRGGPLSPREREVLALIAAGLTNEEIARQLYLSVLTVKRHIANLYGKMGVTRRTQAVALARELGWI